MNFICRLALLVGLFFASGICWAKEPPIPVGVYVNGESHQLRIEFAEDGICYFHDPYFERGQYFYNSQNSVVVCRTDEGVRYKLLLKNGSLYDQKGNRWSPRDEVVKLPWAETSPITFVVLDERTKKPIKDFSYTYRISDSQLEFDPLLVLPIKVSSKDGTFQLFGPSSCEVDLRIEGGPILQGYGSWKEHSVSEQDHSRVVKAFVETGVAIKGIVVDAQTGKPIADARVAPVIFTPPLFTADTSRSVRTNSKGAFVLDGVDFSLGISVTHDDYFEFGAFELIGKAKKIDDSTYEARVALKSGENLHGVVTDSLGKALSEVTVSDGAGKSVKTDGSGQFLLRSPKKWWGEDKYYLAFTLDGFLDVTIHPESAVQDGFHITLKSLPLLNGRVTDSDGNSISAFEVFAGPDSEPRSWACESASSNDSEQGTFELPVRTDRDYGESGQVWIGVKSPGFAFWETRKKTWDGTKSISVTLNRGYSVGGSVQRNDSDPVTVSLLPARQHFEDFTSETSMRQELGRMVTAVREDGSFHFQHVATGKYRLAVSGSQISPLSTGIEVSDSDVHAGSFEPQGRGSIQGVFYEEPEEESGSEQRARGWAFADGEIAFEDNNRRANPADFDHFKPIQFNTDETGRFHVDNVPVGRVRISFSYPITADIIGAHTRFAQVVENQQSHVSFNDPDAIRKLTCKFIVGGGSPQQFATGTGTVAKRTVSNMTDRDPMFLIELKPLENNVGSWTDADWQKLNKDHKVILTDITPGKYRVIIDDWMMSRGLHGRVFETVVDTKRINRLQISLGAGSITGAVNKSGTHVIAIGRQTGDLRHGYSDDMGNFCIRYLKNDQYVLYAHNHDSGWCKLPDTQVTENVTDLGESMLVPGATILGELSYELASDHTITVEAIDSNGVVVGAESSAASERSKFRLSHLWPDDWTILVKRKGDVIHTETITLRDIEKIIIGEIN